MSKKNLNLDKSVAPSEENKLVFEKVNYQLMLAGIAVIVIGFIIMMLETGEYGIGFLGLTLGPVIVVLGFATEFAAILYKSKK
jgi:hypothetical protein